MKKPKSYCELTQTSVESFSTGLRDEMEREMKHNIMKKLAKVHPYAISKSADGRYRTKIKLPDGKMKSVARINEDSFYQELYNFYFGEDSLIFEDVFEKMIERNKNFSKILPKSIEEYQNSFRYFFKNESIAKKSLTQISIADMVDFLDRAHLKTTPKDKKRGKTCIEKHRHNELRTLISKVYAYANMYLNANTPCPLNSLPYNDWPYYDQSKLEHGVYTIEERRKLLEVFDNLADPTLNELCVGFIFETSARNGEARAIRFEDFHFDVPTPYVRICGKANGNIREERVKKDALAGKRNLLMTPRLERIYHLAKERSWSEKYLFVMPKEYASTDNYLVCEQSVGRSLKKICNLAGVKYLSPHQIRFSDATLMAEQGESDKTISNRLGNNMGSYYVRTVEAAKPIAGPAI